MPKYEQAIPLQQLDKETALAIGYQAMKNLGWNIKFAGEDTLLGNTPKKWNSWPLQILLVVQNDTLTVSSEMTNGEAFDMTGKNKKAVASFVAAFEGAKNTDQATLDNNKAAIIDLKLLTNKAAEQEQQNAAEIDQAMHLSGSNLYATYTIIGLNVLMFILMAINGAGIVDLDPSVHVKWGSNLVALTLSGDWWRLFTCTFIHFGIIHLLMNMYCLYMVGIYLEPMLGKAKYITAYICTGILASLVSLWWHSDISNYNSAGASGAIFGMYGLFLALLTTSLIPKSVRQSLLSSIGIFVVYNLVYGMKGGVDNSAHVGGLVSGFVIGYIYAFGIKKEKKEQKLNWIMPVVIIITLGIAVGYLQQNKASAADRNAAQELKYKDNEKYNNKLEGFFTLQKEALNLTNDTTNTVTAAEMINRLDKAKPLWDDAEAIVNEANGYNVSENTHYKASKMVEYIELRKEENALLATLNTQTDQATQDDANQKLKENGKKINAILDELK